MARVRRCGLVVLAALVAALALAGCAGSSGDDTPAGGSGVSNPADFGSLESDVLMLGRSVMGGWFSHWGYDGSTPVEREGHRFVYREIEGGEGIGRSALDAIGEATPGQTVFFKFCFDDFGGGDQASARENLGRNKDVVEDVVSAAERRGVKLIIGNALPKVASSTDEFMVREHRDYNAWLEEIDSKHENVRVFDQYSVLADDGGALKSKYASGSDDSHPNEAGYRALDEAFFAFLKG